MEPSPRSRSAPSEFTALAQCRSGAEASWAVTGSRPQPCAQVMDEFDIASETGKGTTHRDG